MLAKPRRPFAVRHISNKNPQLALMGFTGIALVMNKLLVALATI